MSIRPVDFGGMIQRTDDVGQVKHREDSKPMMDQQNIQVHVDKQQEKKLHQVQHSQDSEKAKNQTDAKEEGKNRYFFQKKKKKASAENEGKVTRKNTSGGFDIKI